VVAAEVEEEPPAPQSEAVLAGLSDAAAVAAAEVRATYSDEKMLGFGAARQKMALERGTHPKPQRRTRSPRNGVPSCRGKSAGVA
jgi:hypothetical protein